MHSSHLYGVNLAAAFEAAASGVDAMVASLAARQHGVVARAQLLALGLSPRMIERRVAAGRLHRIHRGVYAVGHAALDQRGRWLAAVLLAGEDGGLSWRAGAGLLELRPWRGGKIDVTSPRRVRSSKLVRVHRARLPADELVVRDGIPVTGPHRTILDCASFLGKGQLERMFNQLDLNRVWDTVPLAVVLDRHPNAPGRGKVARIAARRQVEVFRTRSDFEQAFLDFLDERGIPRPRTDFDMVANGFDVGLTPLIVDAVWVGPRVIVELDTTRYHGTKAAFERDRRRDRALVAAGWRIIRITDVALRHEPELIARELRLLLGLGSGNIGPV